VLSTRLSCAQRRGVVVVGIGRNFSLLFLFSAQMSCSTCGKAKTEKALFRKWNSLALILKQHIAECPNCLRKWGRERVVRFLKKSGMSKEVKEVEDRAAMPPPTPRKKKRVRTSSSSSSSSSGAAEPEEKKGKEERVVVEKKEEKKKKKRKMTNGAKISAARARERSLQNFSSPFEARNAYGRTYGEEMAEQERLAALALADPEGRPYHDLMESQPRPDVEIVDEGDDTEGLSDEEQQQQQQQEDHMLRPDFPLAPPPPPPPLASSILFSGLPTTPLEFRLRSGVELAAEVDRAVEYMLEWFMPQLRGSITNTTPPIPPSPTSPSYSPTSPSFDPVEYELDKQAQSQKRL